MPMTALEIEQALSVNLDLEGFGEIPSNFTSVNFVRMCGPIVEIVNEKLQFVHFTVQEYVLDARVVSL
jgi:hypothetical protein